MLTLEFKLNTCKFILKDLVFYLPIKKKKRSCILSSNSSLMKNTTRMLDHAMHNSLKKQMEDAHRFALVLPLFS
jgi:hypothetical protein